MFEEDLEALDTADLLAAASEYDQIQTRAAVRVLEIALAYADRHAVVEGYQWLPGYEQLRVYGGDGCPGVAEFAPIEFGAVLGMSSGAAAALIGEALALRHRLPRIWAAVLAGNAVPWRARKVAHACLGLSQEAAAIVDRRVAGIVNTVTPGALERIVKAAVWEADPDAAKAQAEAAARTRGVFVAPSDDHGTKQIWVRAAAGDVIRFDATIDDLARALKTLGDPDDLNQRRAKALGWIADPTAAHHLLEVARHLARTQPTHPEQASSEQASTEPADPQSTDSQPVDRQPTDPQPPHTRTPVTSEAADAAPQWAEAEDRTVQAEHDSPAADDTGQAEQDTPAADDTVQAEPDVPAADDTAPFEVDEAAEEQVSGWDSGAYDSARDGWDDAAYDGGGDGADRVAGDGGDGGDAFTRLALAGSLAERLAAIKRDACKSGLGAGSRRERHTLYVHLTDRTLATGDGVLRVEELGPLLASQLGELLGHGQVVVKPVIDLQDQISVHGYEIPERIRERVRLRHPVDMFPYGGAEATNRMDQDHITPYDRTGPPRQAGQTGQTGTDNLIPLTRIHHRAKTFGGWRSRRLPSGAVDWVSPHGFRFVVDHTGTHQRPLAHDAGGLGAGGLGAGGLDTAEEVAQEVPVSRWASEYAFSVVAVGGGGWRVGLQ
ncbi:HNH endonuclease signature motif containing protein [Kribbella speibonae]|uniref:DUF222 domain-containing protein n=1 Tax=Kribbella speibonae TaxID=1572660 RepID=A0A4R0IXR5_9ACTN|nr:HNH endonuclease signature motif containing protein [Kribbella speibonae]TCC37740.1 hypothetical protein E0H92_14720 [Kribbella speibonae]